MEYIVSIDKQLLIFLNHTNSPFFDYFFWFFTSIPIWIPLYVTIAYVILKQNIRVGLVLVLAIVLTFILTDQISSSIFKNLFERLRPSHEPTLDGLVRIFSNYRGGPFGFVSGHAANSFGLATIVSLIIRNKWLTISLLLWAAINSYSRVYFGVHYPGDVLAGGALGVIVAYLIFWGLDVFRNRSTKLNSWMKYDVAFAEIYSCNSALLIVYSLLTTSAILIILSKLILKIEL